MSDDGYRKKLQRSLMGKMPDIRSLPPCLQDYEVLVLDEAQDCIDAMLDVFKLATKLTGSFHTAQHLMQHSMTVSLLANHPPAPGPKKI